MTSSCKLIFILGQTRLLSEDQRSQIGTKYCLWMGAQLRFSLFRISLRHFHVKNVNRFRTQDIISKPLASQWRHNGRGDVSNHQPHKCLRNRLFRRRSKKTSKLSVTGLCAGNSPGTGEFPAQMASIAEKFSIWWRLYVNWSLFWARQDYYGKTNSYKSISNIAFEWVPSCAFHSFASHADTFMPKK